MKKDAELIITVPSKFIPLDKKHYQHFSEESLRETLSPFFQIEDIFGQNKVSFSFWKFFYKLLDNRIWKLKKLTKCYNKYIWTKYLNKCEVNEGERLIVYCKNEK